MKCNVTVSCDTDCSHKADALGGPAVLAFLSRGTLVIAVEENQTSMRVSADTLLGNTPRRGTVVHAKSYAEAAGIIVAHKAGILLESITNYVSPLTI